MLCNSFLKFEFRTGLVFSETYHCWLLLPDSRNVYYLLIYTLSSDDVGKKDTATFVFCVGEVLGLESIKSNLSSAVNEN